MIPEQKKCKHCGEVKSSSEYNRAGGGAWLQPYCKPCDSFRKKEYNKIHSERIKEKSRANYLKKRKLVDPIEKEQNKKKNIERLVKFNRENRKPKMSEEERKRRKSINDKKYRERMGEILREKKRAYSRKNRERNNEKSRIKNRENLELRIKKNLRSRIRFALLSKNSNKLFATIKYLGCDVEFFKKYLESKFKDGMNWDNYGKYGWHIDHIIPCCKFDLTKEEEQKKCFHYTNQQPLWATENLKKGAKI